MTGGAAADVAWSGIDSLVATYSSTPEAVQDELDEWQPGKPLGDALKSFLHEDLHLIQVVSTSYGLFQTQLRRLQTECARAVILTLADAGVPVRPPMLDRLTSIPENRRQVLSDALGAWVSAEERLGLDYGSLVSIGALWGGTLPEPARFVLEEMSGADRFRPLQFQIANLYNGLQEQLPPTMRRPAYLAPEAFLEEPEEGSYEKGFTLTFTQRLTSSEAFTFIGLIESAARALELWGETEAVIAAASRLSRGFDDVAFQWNFHTTADQVGAHGGQTVVVTHLALCNLALNGPTPPSSFPRPPTRLEMV